MHIIKNNSCFLKNKLLSLISNSHMFKKFTHNIIVSDCIPINHET